MAIDTVAIYILTYVNHDTYVLLRRTGIEFSPLITSITSSDDRPLNVVKTYFKNLIHQEFPLLERIRPRGYRRAFLPYTEVNTTRVYCSFMCDQHNPDLYEGNDTQWVKVYHLFEKSFPWCDPKYGNYWLSVKNDILEKFFITK